jgi:hypothetical protein
MEKSSINASGGRFGFRSLNLRLRLCRYRAGLHERGSTISFGGIVP